MIRVLIALAFSLTLAVAAEPPRRIVSTAPGITEILFALGLGGRVVGVTDYCKYPPEATKLPKIGSWMTPNLEVIASLRPDLLIVQRTAVHESAPFRALQIKTADVRLDRAADIFASIEAIGKAAGVPDRARELNRHIHAELDAIRARVAGRPRVAVLFVVGRDPGTVQGIVAVGPGSYLSEMIDLAGGRNVLADAASAWVKVAPEEILARKPEVILDIGENAGGAEIPESRRRAEIALWGVYGSLPAVRNSRVHILTSEVFLVPGPRMVECARQIARLLHPELFH